jgi:hypothetical protein
MDRTRTKQLKKKGKFTGTFEVYGFKTNHDFNYARNLYWRVIEESGRSPRDTHFFFKDGYERKFFYMFATFLHEPVKYDKVRG